MNTILIFVLFVSGIIILGFAALFLSEKSEFQKSIVPITISFLSISALVYLITIFKQIVSGNSVELIKWQMPYGKILLEIDPLTAFFLVPLLILTAATSLYGWKYFGNHRQEKSHWLFFALLVAGMVLVLLSRNAIAFIFSWEIMSVSSFFLVISDKTNKSTMRAGLIYFITAHIGAAFLFVLFFILGNTSGSFDFVSWNNLHLSSFKASLIFILALIAFGSKAGFIPFHVWLPLAHPSAPSHVSALMSGIMIKMGIYGIFRILTFISPYQKWWGILLIIIGAISGILGVLFAIGQHDIKKLLAYHSVENIGIIMLGMGVGVAGAAFGYPKIAFFGFAGSLLHVVNHAMFKGLLFLGAGSIIRQTGTGEIDRLGGLIKRMPITALLFIIGSIAIAGLPFFNGFISELMIYIASLSGAINATNSEVIFICLFTGVSLALIGGLAVACFTKVIGVIFLGEERKELNPKPAEVPFSMILSMISLATVCILIGMGSYFIVPFLIKPVAIMTNSVDANSVALLTQTTKVVTIVLFSVLILGGLITFLLKIIIKKNKVVSGVETWGCGYSSPKTSMQYTASSFAQPITDYFSTALDISKEEQVDTDYFPDKKWTFKSHANDWILTKIYEPLVLIIGKLFTSLRWLQNGKIGLYVLYIAITIIGLIIWKFFI